LNTFFVLFGLVLGVFAFEKAMQAGVAVSSMRAVAMHASQSKYPAMMNNSLLCVFSWLVRVLPIEKTDSETLFL